MPRYTFIWWGDGYFVYDGEDYIGKDDQLDELDLLMAVGAARRIDAEDKSEIIDDNWRASLSEMLAALGEEVAPSS